MDLIIIGSYAGILSGIIHAGQGVFSLMKHFKLVSTCCGAVSSIEIDVSTNSPPPKIRRNSNSNSKGKRASVTNETDDSIESSIESNYL